MRTSLHEISGRVWVAAQIDLADIRDLANAGFTLLVNHRPDDEEPGQPTSVEIARRAADVGLLTLHAPVRGLPDANGVAATRDALDGIGLGDKAPMFGRSAMRSACAWAMAERRNGAEPDALRQTALKAGHDLGRLSL